MRIAILGASGKTGKPLIEQALAAGHEVIAIVRTPEKLALNDPRVDTRKGDAFDADSDRVFPTAAIAATVATGPPAHDDPAVGSGPLTP